MSYGCTFEQGELPHQPCGHQRAWSTSLPSNWAGRPYESIPHADLRHESGELFRQLEPTSFDLVFSNWLFMYLTDEVEFRG